MTGTRANLFAERVRALADIAHYEAILARVPGSRRHQVALEDERAHLERVEATLRSAGWDGS